MKLASYNTRYGFGADGRLDYCFVDASLAPAVRGCRVDTEARGSGHFPVFIEIELDTPDPLRNGAGS